MAAATPERRLAALEPSVARGSDVRPELGGATHTNLIDEPQGEREREVEADDEILSR